MPFEELRFELGTFLEAHPDRAGDFLEICKEVMTRRGVSAEERTLTYKQAADRSGLSLSHLSKLHTARRLGGEVDGKVRFSPSELDEYVTSSQPGRRPSVVNGVVAEPRSATNTDATQDSQPDTRLSSRIELFERSGDPLIQNVASLWDRRGALSRREFVREFQAALDEFHTRGTLGAYAADRALCRWINTIARTERIKLMLPMHDSGDLAVTIECQKRKGGGYFVPRMARRIASAVSGRSSHHFPKLSAMPL